MNPFTGETIWDHSIIVYDEFGNIISGFLSDIYELSDGSIIAGGAVEKVDSTGQSIGYDSWIIRLGESGCFDSSCEFESLYTITVDQRHEELNQEPMVFPNPTTDCIELKSSVVYYDKIIYQVYSVNGLRVKVGHIQLNGKICFYDIEPGLYFVAFYDDHKGLLSSHKVILH